ncbi:IucA/IucC family siderophore biosynthesis protein [Laspinema sp. D1]|uniref:IucA/IucC family protein n=1 Tax=Laspinema palackyanum TaxID=3231601 RepID=UPI003490C5B7|nr:IucA/IucC family siderophore biosynthesis protein [Laspinema sp. D2b]
MVQQLTVVNREQNINLTDKQIADRATIQSFLNCYLKETRSGKLASREEYPELQTRLESPQIICCSLPHQGIKVKAGVRYFSPTGRHCFEFPLYYQMAEKSELLELDYVTLVALFSKELALTNHSSGSQDELLLRVVQSCRNIEQFVRDRRRDAEILTGFHSTFGETEQALIFGHLLHPTPKSRQGFADEDLPIYSPELKGKFPLHYFRLHPSIVLEGSALPETATQLIKTELIADPQVSQEFKQQYCQPDEYSLLPLHPWQAQYLRRQPVGQTLFNQGLIEDLGPQGRAFLPTSSIRTVYHSDAAFMFKLSLNVKITNSVRMNLYKELERSVEVHQILAGPIGEELRQNYPQFDIIRDPAFLAVQFNGEPLPAFATILRQNPFQTNPSADATCISSLCQDSIYGDGSRLANLIRTLAKQENRTSLAVSLDWFRRYLQISLQPILWLYFTHGIAVEAHQQNSVLQLAEGYPERFYYRDNQGYYFRQSCYEHLHQILPGIGEKSQTVCDDAVADERLAYYFFQNNLFGLINGFGVAGLVDEKLLLAELRQVLEQAKTMNTNGSNILENLSQPKLRCKANLLTRFHDMDELVGSLATQSVYVGLDNPLVAGL